MISVTIISIPRLTVRDSALRSSSSDSTTNAFMPGKWRTNSWECTGFSAHG